MRWLDRLAKIQMFDIEARDRTRIQYFFMSVVRMEEKMSEM